MADDAPKQQAAITAPTKADIVRVREEIEMRQERIHVEAAEGVEAMLMWAELTEEDLIPAGEGMPLQVPQRFVDRFGNDAQRMFNIAKAANMPSSDAPIGLKLTVDIYRGAMAAAARRSEGSGTKVAMLVQLRDVDVPESIVVKADK